MHSSWTCFVLLCVPYLTADSLRCQCTVAARDGFPTGVTIQWTGLLDWNTGLDYWTTGLTYFWFLHILRLVLLSLPSKNPLGTCSPLLNTEDKQWNMQKLSLNNFATVVHYATIQHLFLTWCVVMLQAVQGTEYDSNS